MCRAFPVRRHAVDNTNQLQHILGRGLLALLQRSRPHRRFMGVLMLLATVQGGCAFPWAAKKTVVEWPDPDSTPLVGAPMEAGAALAAAAAVREMVKERLAADPGLFRGCSSPEQGLDVAIFKDPKTGLYYVVLDERFDRCGGPGYVRTLDAWYEYAVTAQGEVLGKAPAMDLGPPTFRPPSPAPPESTPPPAAPLPATDAGTPASAPSPTPASPPSRPEVDAPPPAPSPASSLPTTPPVAPPPASPPSTSPAPGSSGPASTHPEGP